MLTPAIVRQIARSRLKGRDRLYEFKALAEGHGWLDAGAELPDAHHQHHGAAPEELGPIRHRAARRRDVAAAQVDAVQGVASEARRGRAARLPLRGVSD